MAGNPRVKEVHVAHGGGVGPAADGARAERFVVCHSPEQDTRDAAVRDHLLAHLRGLIDRSGTWTGRRHDDLVGSLLIAVERLPLTRLA